MRTSPSCTTETTRSPSLVYTSPRASLHPSTFVLLDWRGGRVMQIRDFRYVPYIADEVLHGRAAFRADANQEQGQEQGEEESA